MSRWQRHGGADMIEPPTQIADLAFNIRGHALEDGLRERRENEVINAYSPVAVIFTTAVKSLSKADEEVWRESLAFTPRELGGIEEGLRPYLVVGYALREPPPGTLTASKESKKQRPVGITRPDSVISWAESNVIYVVSEILEAPKEGVQLWALLKPNLGVCTPYQIGQDAVFYRWEFRDASTSIRARGVNWNRLVTNQAVRPGFGGRLPSAKQKRYKPARGATRFTVEPQQSLSNECLMLILASQKNKDKWFLTELQDVFAEVDADPRYRPPPTNKALRLFVEGEEELSAEVASDVVDEIQEQWPEVEDVTADRVIRLKRGMIQSGIHLEYRLLRGFVAEAMYRLAHHFAVSAMPIDDDDPTAQLVKEVVCNVQRVTPLKESTPVITSMSEEGAFLATLRNKLIEVSFSPIIIAIDEN